MGSILEHQEHPFRSDLGLNNRQPLLGTRPQQLLLGTRPQQQQLLLQLLLPCLLQHLLLQLLQLLLLLLLLQRPRLPCAPLLPLLPLLRAPLPLLLHVLLLPP